ncbi:hypothetical protein DSL72_003324 [Monilinia vaccinii-corymbosi]|uniref:N-acetyltransferase domain-containing protein n=1 Tax=Monilinia vaccinii-corymbosi TaxID=61207 RepID=A0A8A3P7T4_9HELO|nr:hypothetical protein DSL72_003324 [Monilinia vaccinii-corymbosi]
MSPHTSTIAACAIPIPILDPKPRTNSNLRLLPCDPLVDGPAIHAQQTAAFSDPPEPFIFVLFPETEEREKAVKRLVDSWVGDEKATYLKVVHEDGTLISAAKLLVNTESLSEEQRKEQITVDWHPDQESNEWAAYLINWVHQYQISRTKGEPCVILEIISTHPSYQRLGAGTLLMQRLTAIADSHNLPAFIEGTAIAKHLYESHGFRAIPDRYIEVDVPQKWMARPKIEFLLYERPRSCRRV